MLSNFLGDLFYFLSFERYSPRAFADQKRKAPKGPMIPYFGQERSLASARLEIHGIPVAIRKGMAQDRGRTSIMKDTERESIKLYVSKV